MQTPTELNKCLVSESEEYSLLDSDNKNPLAKNGVSSTCFTSIKKTAQVASNFDSTNTYTGKNELQSPELAHSVGSSEMQFSRQCEDDVESTQVPNVVNSSETKQCMDLSDDSVIPPTPSPVDSNKNTSRISISVNKNKTSKQTSGYFSNKQQRNYKHIKKPNISALNRNVGPSKFNMKKTQNSKRNDSLHISESVKENLLLINKIDYEDNNDFKMDEDMISWSGDTKMNVDEKVDELDGVKSIRNSSLRLSRKTFKLSKKGKKTETGKQPSNKKLEPERCENDIFSGYGARGNIVDNDLVKNDQDGDGNDDEGSRPPVRSRVIGMLQVRSV